MGMALRSIVRGIGSISRRGYEEKHSCGRGRSDIAPEQTWPSSEPQSRWADMPPELLLHIIQRVEESQVTWPARRDVVACALVCRSWRRLTMELVKTPEQCGLLTLPISLKQPGPRDSPIQCFIKRERATSTYLLYLGLTPALSGDESKLLLAARKVRRVTSTEFVISFVGKDSSRAGDAFVGKLRSNFLGTKFSIYDSQPPFDPSMQSNCRMGRKIRSKQVSPRVPVGNYNVANIVYELNVLRTRGPRRMRCTLNSIPISSIQQGGTAPTPTDFRKCLDEPLDPVPVSKGNTSLTKLSSSSNLSEAPQSQGTKDGLILINKSPRWHEQLQCWCLNFRGRVTVASVKNFQLVAAAEPSQNISATEQEKVILQFGKIGKDIFTMDYRYPLSSFQAFAICLSSFDTKPACE